MIRSVPAEQNTEEPPTRLYSVAEAADHLGLSRQGVYNLINAGAIRIVELGTTRSKLRIRADDLQAFIDQRTHGGKP